MESYNSRLCGDSVVDQERVQGGVTTDGKRRRVRARRLLACCWPTTSHATPRPATREFEAKVEIERCIGLGLGPVRGCVGRLVLERTRTRAWGCMHPFSYLFVGDHINTADHSDHESVTYSRAWAWTADYITTRLVLCLSSL